MTETTNANKNAGPLTLKFSTFIYTMLVADIPLCLISLAFGSWLLYHNLSVGYLFTYGIAAIVIGILGLAGNSLLLKQIRTGLSFCRVNIVFTFVSILALATLFAMIETKIDKRLVFIIFLAEAVRIGCIICYAFAISKAGDAFENLEFAKEEQQSFNDRYKKKS